MKSCTRSSHAPRIAADPRPSKEMAKIDSLWRATLAHRRVVRKEFPKCIHVLVRVQGAHENGADPKGTVRPLRNTLAMRSFFGSTRVKPSSNQCILGDAQFAVPTEKTNVAASLRWCHQLQKEKVTPHALNSPLHDRQDINKRVAARQNHSDAEIRKGCSR